MSRSNCDRIGCNLSNKHKLTLYKTQNGESNLVTISSSLIFTRSYPSVQNLGDIHPNIKERASWLIHVLCDFKATWYQEACLSVCWIHHGSTSCWCLYLSWKSINTQNLETNRLVVSWLTQGIWQMLTQALESLEEFHFNGLSLSKVYIAWDQKWLHGCFPLHSLKLQYLYMFWAKSLLVFRQL